MKNLAFPLFLLFSLSVWAQVAPTAPTPPVPPVAGTPPVPPVAPAAPNDTTIINVGKTIKVQIVDKNKKGKKGDDDIEISVDSENEKLSEEIENAVREALKGLENIDVDIDIDHDQIADQLRNAQQQMETAKRQLQEQINRLKEENNAGNEEAQRANEEAQRELEEAQREMENAQRELEREMRTMERQNLEDNVRVEVHTDAHAHAPNAEVKKMNRVKTRYLLFDMGVSTYLHEGSFNLPSELEAFEQRYGRSLDYNLHVFKQRVGFAKNHVNLLYGLGFNFSNYSFENPITLLKNTNPLEITLNENIDYRKNKLVTTSVNVPVMINFETNPRKAKKSFRIGAGVYGGLLIGSHTRQKSNEEGNDKVRDDFNLNKVRYGFLGQVGIGPINFYANYSPQSLFKEDRGPDLQPLNIGVSIIPF